MIIYCKGLSRSSLCLDLFLLLLSRFFSLLLHFHFLFFLLLLGLLLFLFLSFLLLGQKWHFGNWILDEESVGLSKVCFDLRQVLDVLVPAEKVVVLNLLLISEFNHVIV